MGQPSNKEERDERREALDEEWKKIAEEERKEEERKEQERRSK